MHYCSQCGKRLHENETCNCTNKLKTVKILKYICIVATFAIVGYYLVYKPSNIFNLHFCDDLYMDMMGDVDPLAQLFLAIPIGLLLVPLALMETTAEFLLNMGVVIIICAAFWIIYFRFKRKKENEIEIDSDNSRKNEI